jgi:hypothetical protein
VTSIDGKNQVAAKVFGRGDSSNGVNGAEVNQWQASRAVRSEVAGEEAPPLNCALHNARNDGMLESLRPQLLVNVTHRQPSSHQARLIPTGVTA